MPRSTRSRLPGGAAVPALLAATGLLLAESAARAEPDGLFSPAGVYRYDRATSYELSWSVGGVPFAPAGAGLSGASLRLRETNGPVASLIVTVLSALGGAAATTSNAKDAYNSGQIDRNEANRRIADGDERAQRMLTSGYSGALFDADVTLYSDKLGGEVTGVDGGIWIGKHVFDVGPTLALFEWGLKGARVWGSTLALPDAPELFDHAHLGGMLQLRADATRFLELHVRFDPNVLRLFSAPSHESPLWVGAMVSPVELLFVGGDAVFTGLSSPALRFTAGVRL